MKPKQVIITVREYEQLIDDSMLLSALKESGVANWEGWSDALALKAKWENDLMEDYDD